MPTLTVTIVDLISWALTVISIVLFILERKNNKRLPYYMAIQGILRACKEKSGFYATHHNEVKSRDNAK